MKKTTTILLVSGLAIIAVGVLGFTTKGFRDFNLKKTAYEKQIEKYDIKDALIKMNELTYDQTTNVISQSKYYVYVSDSVDVTAIEIPNTYGETYASSYDMIAIKKTNGTYLNQGSVKIYHYDQYTVFSFYGPADDFKLKKADGSYHNLSAISYATANVIEPVAKPATTV